MIYLCTFYFARNAGAVLQAFALSSYLRALGYQVKFVKYIPKKMKKELRLINSDSLIDFIKSICLLPHSVHLKNNYELFVKQHFDLTETCKTVDDIADLVQPRLYITGSDQVWNSEITGGIDVCYFMTFQTTANKASYAASVGNDDTDDTEWKNICNALKSFDAISVREENVCENLVARGVNATWVLDPVFLLDPKIYRENSIMPNLKEDYVLLYYTSEESIKLAKKVAAKYNCKVINISKIKTKDGVIGMPYYSPQEFLGYIQNAKFVITTSFHATAFSIILEKPFYTTGSSNRSQRMQSLLDSIGLEDRYIDERIEIDNLDICEVDYKVSKEKLLKRIDLSKEFIKSAIEDNSADRV